MKDKCAVILCGGRGTRLGQISKKIPKTLVKVQNKEILWYIMNHLISLGFNKFILPLGYKGNQIKNFLKKKKFKANVLAIETGENSDIGFRISKIIKYIDTPDFVLLNGDAIFDFDLRKILKNHIKNKYDISFLSGEVIYPYGTIGVINNRVKDFSRNLVYDKLKVRKNNNYTGYNYSGICIIKTKILLKFKKLLIKVKNFEQIIYPKIIKSGLSKLVKIKGFWHSIDNLKDLSFVDDQRLKSIKYFKLRSFKKKLMGKVPKE